MNPGTQPPLGSVPLPGQVLDPDADGRISPLLLVGRLLDQSSQAFAMADMSGRLIHGNRAFLELLGLSVEELPALTILDITAEPSRKATVEAAERLFGSGKAQRYEKAYRRKDGTDVLAEVVVDLFRDEANQPIGSFAFITDISERKQAEAALRVSEERFRRLYDEAPFGYHEIDANGTILIVNRTECEMLGYTREDLVGRSIYDLIHPSQREQARAAVKQRMREEIPLTSVERTYMTQDGEELIVSIENRLIRNEQGKAVGVRSTMQDITPQKQAEAALVASERRLRALFEGIEDAVFVHDIKGRILDANPASCRRLGYTREELLKLSTRDIDDPSFATGFEDRLDQQLRHGHLRIEGRHRTKAGRIIPVDINTSTIQLEDQTVVLAVIRDITERKALEETRRQFAEAQLRNAWEIEAKNRALGQSEARYRQLTEGCLDAIVVTDQAGRITLFNPAAEQAFGYQAEEVIGSPLIQLVTPEHRGALMAGLHDYLHTRTGQIVGKTVELRGTRKDGEGFPLELSLSAIDIAGELQFLGAIRDQTERQRMRLMLMQSEKLASIGLLSAGVAHEINNPLAYIANNLAVLERDLKGVLAMMRAYEAAHGQLATRAPEVLQEIQALSDDLDWPYVRDNLGRMLSRTRDGVQRVATIVQNLRGFARTAPQKLEQTLLSDLVEGAVEMVQGRIRRNQIEIRVENLSTSKIACVPTDISQVLLNLLVNAIQAIEATGRTSGNTIRVVIRQDADTQVVEFHDNGCGIPADALPRLFDPFFTTKPVGEGTGLGLSISHGIITGHGGQIDVESDLGRGTCFRVILPGRPPELAGLLGQLLPREEPRKE